MQVVNILSSTIVEDSGEFGRIIDSGFLRSSVLGHAQGTGLDFQAVILFKFKPRYFGRMI